MHTYDNSYLYNYQLNKVMRCSIIKFESTIILTLIEFSKNS